MTNLLPPDTSGNVTTTSRPDEKEDGRSLRRQRNRDAVIRSLIELIREGDLAPTVGRIADRAELSHRSVFRYFDDLDDLARTAIETEFRESHSLSIVADVGLGTLTERIDRLVDASLVTLDRTHLLGLAARARAQEIAEVDQGLTLIFQLHFDQIRAHFAPELASMEPDMADAIANSIAITTWLDSYDLLHRTFGRSVDDISAMWRTTLRVLLT
ncbi:TetR/AcrR family transcriptional regulator [Ilumatobacter sp.]|uniref:TetR/AcrR family transcriptional regulator n=1 Tax=Ilumatobacter sp. TaxID=1967498 RepID=UPI003C396AE7